MVRVASGSTVKDVAEYLGVAVPEVIKKLMTMGEMVTLTQTLSDEAIQVIADEFDKTIEIVRTTDEEEAEPAFEDADEDLVDRPPVVTIMGHVDHGKTSLLDAIRETEVVAGEAGGITQHIGAYQVHHNDKLVTFLDTPGHEAFTAMRARGAQVTDIAVIVVAADDGVKPQTDEAIDHAKAAEVPILVAVNKIDKEGADPTRVRTEMTQRDLQPAEWGGETEFVDVSAKTRQGLDDLLDTILVVAELEELKANPSVEASGVVIESKLDPGRGPVVTVLVSRGTLKVGDAIVAGSHWGKVRAMSDYKGLRQNQAEPGEPVEVLGFDGVPDAGDPFRVVENDRTARQLANERSVRLRNEAQARRSGRKVSFDDIFRGIQQGEVKELDLLIKADVSGSLEAFEDEIARLPQDEVTVNVIRSGVGGINESDVMLAAASDAIILGFNVRPVGDASGGGGARGRGDPHLRRHLQRARRPARRDAGHARSGAGRGDDGHRRGAPDLPRLEDRHDRRLLRHRRAHRARRTGAHRARRHGHLRHDDRHAAALQRRRARGRRRLRVRHHADELPGRQGGRRARGLRDEVRRALALLGAGRTVAMSAYVALLLIHLHFPEAQSLKGKRSELQSVKAQLHTRLGAAVAEVDHQDTWQRSTLAATLCSGSLRTLDGAVDGVVRWLDGRFPEGVRVERSVASFEEAGGIG